ncbi:MAG TPA: hypothetical protein VLK23_06010 [Thermodesulfobacteriota bacterium]|nr:hypothetical protein [Thermodesulfobacteriota bacterium]
MNLRYLKTALVVLASFFVIQGCSVYVRDDNYPRYRHRHHYQDQDYQFRGGVWWRSSLEQPSLQSPAQELAAGEMWSRRG